MGVNENQAAEFQFEAIKNAARRLVEPGRFYVGDLEVGIPGMDKEAARAWLEEYYGVPYIIDEDFVVPA